MDSDEYIDLERALAPMEPEPAQTHRGKSVPVAWPYSEPTVRAKKSRRKFLAWSLVVATLVSGGASYFLPWQTNRPDLNKDQIEDVVRRNVYGHILPFKGIQFGTPEGDYLNLKKMEFKIYEKHRQMADEELLPYRNSVNELRQPEN